MYGGNYRDEKNSTSHLLLAKITFEATAHIFERSVVHHSTGQTCMLLYCSTSQSELHAAEAENFTSCILAEYGNHGQTLFF